MREAGLLRRGTLGGGSLSGFQEGADARYRRRTGFAAVAQIEYKAGIANRVPAESGGRGLAPIQEFLDFTK
jgi:hypothetical protein